MSEERALVDTQGKFVQVVKDGRKVNDLEWLSGRIILSNKRVVLVSNEGKETIVLGRVQSIKNRSDVDQAIAPVSGYFSLQVGADVHLVAPADIDTFEQELYGTTLDGQVVLVKHPAVEGGVVRDTSWEKGQLNVEPDEVGLGVASGQFVEIELVDVGAVAVTERTVRGSERRVLEVEHTVGEGTSVETHVTGSTRHVAFLESLVRQGELENAADVELDQTEREVLMALYSGVSPFEIPEFVGIDVTEVEAVFDHLVEQGILTEKRVRREVKLKARGRNIANEAMADQ
jgi:helix-turn-helix protein